MLHPHLLRLLATLFLPFRVNCDLLLFGEVPVREERIDGSFVLALWVMLVELRDMLVTSHVVINIDQFPVRKVKPAVEKNVLVGVLSVGESE